MSEVILKVTYRVRADAIAEFEDALLNRVVPLASRLGIRLKGIWRTLVGPVGEYLELWEFQSVADYEEKWKTLMNHAEIQEIFRKTGSIVSDEVFSLVEPVWPSSQQPPERYMV